MLHIGWFICVLALIKVSLGSTKKTLYIGGFFTMSNKAWPGGLSTLPTSQLAVDIVNNNSEILPDYELKLLWNDTMASPTVSMRILFDFLYKKPTKLMLIGPNLSKNTVPVAEAASAWNLLQVSFSARSAELIDKTRFPYLYSTLPNDNIYNPLRVKFFQRFGWKRVALLFEYNSANLYSSTTEDFVALWRAQNHTVVAVEGLSNIPLALDSLKRQEARIIVGNFHFEAAKRLFCEVYKRGMYGPKYVWIILGWIGTKWWNYPFPHVDCTADQIRIAQEGSFLTDLTPEAKGYSEVFGLNSELIKKYIVNIYAGFAFDAMMSIALTLHEADQQGIVLEDFNYDNKSYVDAFQKIISAIRFDGVTGPVAFESNGNRIATTVILQSTGYSHRTVASYNPFTKDFQLESDVATVWKDGRVPLDGPVRTRVQIFFPETTFISFGVVAALGIILAVAFLGFNIKNRNLRYIKMSSPNMNNIMASGCIFSYIALVLNGLDSRLLSQHKHSLICNVRVIVLSMGFTLSFGAIFCKTMRVHMIVSSKKTQKRVATRYIKYFRIIVRKAPTKSYGVTATASMTYYFLEKIIKDIHLVYVIAVLLAVDTVFFTTWMAVDPLHTSVINFPEKADPNNDDYISQPYLEKCSSDHEVYWVVNPLYKELCSGVDTGISTTVVPIDTGIKKRVYWVVCILFYKGVFLLFGLFLAWETRNIRLEALNDSKYIGMSVYNVSVICLIGVPVGYLIDETNTSASYILSSMCLILCTTITLCLVFVPKIHGLMLNPSGEVSGKIHPTTVGSGKYTETQGMSLDTLTERITIQKRLETLLQEKDSRIKELESVVNESKA